MVMVFYDQWSRMRRLGAFATIVWSGMLLSMVGVSEGGRSAEARMVVCVAIRGVKGSLCHCGGRCTDILLDHGLGKKRISISSWGAAV